MSEPGYAAHSTEEEKVYARIIDPGLFERGANAPWPLGTMEEAISKARQIIALRSEREKGETHPKAATRERREASKAATVPLCERPEDVRAAQGIVREYAFDLMQPFVNAGTETTAEVDRLTHAMFTLINATWEIENARKAHG